MDFTQHIAGLERDRAGVKGEVEAARAVLRQHESRLSRLDMAISALAGRRVAPAKRRGARGQGGTHGGGVTNDEVAGEIRAALASGPVQRSELQDQVRESLREKGRKLNGYPLRFGQLLAGDGFVVESDRVRLP